MCNSESANELFHFTKKIESLKSIMNNKFKPFYCIEDISFMYEDHRNITFAFPIVCFCDLPLERISNHRENYGDYGIGLTKEWGIRNNFNIVNYSFRESRKSGSYRLLVDFAFQKCSDLNEDLNRKFRNAFNILLMTSKPYQGKKFDKINRKWSNIDIRFYDEREWRYLPLVDKLNWSLSPDDFSGDYDAFFEAIEKEEPKIQEKYTLNFNVNDIKYIFLKDKHEIENFLNDISDNYNEIELKTIKNLICIK